jgi:hypothetical protein
MSEPDGAPLPPSTETPPPRNGCLTALMVIVGVVLLLPGLCAAIFGVASFSEPQIDSSVMGFVVIGLLLGFAGIMLIRAVIRGPRR